MSLGPLFPCTLPVPYLHLYTTDGIVGSKQESEFLIEVSVNSFIIHSCFPSSVTPFSCDNNSLPLLDPVKGLVW